MLARLAAGRVWLGLAPESLGCLPTLLIIVLPRDSEAASLAASSFLRVTNACQRAIGPPITRM
jgi:hypothetical protein